MILQGLIMLDFPMLNALRRGKVMRAERFISNSPMHEWPKRVIDIGNSQFLQHHNGKLEHISNGNWVLYLLNAEMEIISNLEFQLQYEVVGDE